MQYSFKNHAFLIIAFFSALLTQSGCKENSLINSKVSPANNTVGVYNTSLSLISHTYYNDTALTSLYLGLPVVQGVGSMTDPFFGTMTGATYFQVLPNTPTDAVYGSTDVVDSVALVLPYTGFSYGDTTDQAQTITYQVFYMQDTLGAPSTANYFSFTTKQLDEIHPLSAPVSVNLYTLKDSVSVNGLNFHPGLRIPLNWSVLGPKLLSVLHNISTSATPNTDFVSQFPGICVRVGDTRHSAKSFPYFQLDGTYEYAEAGIHVYHHMAGNPADTLHERYLFAAGYCTFFNNISKSYSHSPVNRLLTSVQPNDTIVALQNQPGASIDIVIPGIKSLPKGIINKADLQLTLLPGYNQDVYMAPQRISVRGVGNGVYPVGVNAGGEYTVADRYPLTSLTPYAILDGQSHALTINGTAVNQYVIGIPREVMASIAAGNDTLHLHISGSQDYYGAFHMIAGGGNYPDSLYKAKLFVVYSKLN